MAKIGFVVHSQREGAVGLAEATASWLRDLGHGAEILDPRDGAQTPAPVPALDLAVSMGGDGTMLRTVDLVSPDGVPVLGVNMGHLGYLTAVEPEDLHDALTRFLAGDYQIESRMTLDVSVTDESDSSQGNVLHQCALNDAVLQRTKVGHTMRTEVSVGGVPFLTFASDSLILATPTGSTAYNLSARGPIVSPRARVQILTPVAPHMLFDRSLIFDADEEVTLTPIGDQPADVVVDGWLVAQLHPGQALHARSGDCDAKLVTFGARDFHRILKSKFNLADR